MSVQTSYGYQGDIASMAGDLADNGPTDKVSASTAAALDFGRVVAFSGAGACKVPAAATDITGSPLGIALRDYSAASTTGYAAKDMVSILSKGRVYVNVEGAVTAGGDVYVRYDGTGNAGECLAAAVTDEAVKLPGAKFRSTTTGAGVAVVEVNLPA